MANAGLKGRWKLVEVVLGACVQTESHHSAFTSPHGQRSDHRQLSTEVLDTH